MSQYIDAIYENGVFRPEQPVNIHNGERVSLTVDSKASATDDLRDVFDLLDTEFIETCRKKAGQTPSLESVRTTLSTYRDSIAELISEERDER